MNRISKIFFQYYQNKIKSSVFAGTVSLDQFIRAHQEPKQHTIELFNQIAYYESIGDMKTKAELKKRLYSFTPCVVVKQKRKYDDILNFTGLLVLDFDHIHNAPEFKEYLFHEYDFIIAAWLSPSKRGVKALVKIPVVKSIDDFKAYYYGIGNKMWEYNGFDGSGQNCVLPLFQSYDPDLLVRDNPGTWTVKGFKPSELNQEYVNPPDPVTPSSEKESIILKIIDTGLNRIFDNGHPQLRSLCLSVGGYVANRYIDLNTAISYINGRIQSHAYLRKDVRNYQKTVRWAITEGLTKPLHLKHS